MAPRLVLKPNTVKSGVTDHDSYRYIDARDEATGLRLTDFDIMYGRAGIRIDGDAHDIQIGPGQLSAKAVNTGSDLPVGIDLRGTVHNVTITGVESFNNQMKDVGGYTNGDGFSSEAGTHDITYVGCSSHDNSDGGYDNKGVRIAHLACMAWNNHRNARVWQDASYANPVFGDAHDSHFWLGGGAKLTLIGVVTINSTTKAPLFNAGGHSGTVDCTQVTEWRINVPAGTPLTHGPLTMLYGDLGKPDLTKQWTAPVEQPPAPPAPVYDYTTKLALADNDGDGFITVVSNPALVKLFGKGTVLKLVAHDADGYHYEVQK